MNQYFKKAFYLSILIGFSWATADQTVDFFRAVQVDNDRTVSALLLQGFDPNTPNADGHVALFVALRNDAPKVLQTLLAHPAIHVDRSNAADESPLMMASLRGNLDGAKLLIGRGAAVNRSGWTPLHYAASGPSLPMIEFLLQRGADINAPSPNRSTPLMMAAGYGPPDAVELLLGKGADARARNDKGLSASDFARIALHDLDEGTSTEIRLEDLYKNVHLFAFIPGYKQHTFADQDPINIEAVELLGDLHDELEAGGYTGHQLERFLVRVGAMKGLLFWLLPRILRRKASA